MIVVCVQTGNYAGRGADYVNTLRDMVARNLKAQHRFLCFTDDSTGIECEAELLPPDLDKWWGKLYLFKRGLFPVGERVVYLDLDTIIVGSLDHVFAYDGYFATLQDFYWPHLVGPAVMMWEADTCSGIWDEWEAAGKPRHSLGDLWWINQLAGGEFVKAADRLQMLYPCAFVSYKVHCQPEPNEDARVVCFHGKPKVSDLPPSHWAHEHWRRS